MSKISTYAIQAIVKATDYLLGDDSTGPTTKRFLLSDILTYILNNIPATEGTFAFVSTGLVWSGDAYASTRAASMTSGRIRVNTTFLAIAAVTARIFTASKDTYIDVLDNLDGTGTLVYTEVTNNAASPALAANSVRIGIIVTGASNIANAGSVNQGQEGALLPIVSSTPYAVTESLGNLINPRDSNRKIIGQRQIVTDFSTATTGSYVDVTGLSVPFIVPTGRKIKATAYGQHMNMSGGAPGFRQFAIREGATAVGETVGSNSASYHTPSLAMTPALTLSAGLHTYVASAQQNAAGNYTLGASALHPAFLLIELE